MEGSPGSATDSESANAGGSDQKSYRQKLADISLTIAVFLPVVGLILDAVTFTGLLGSLPINLLGLDALPGKYLSVGLAIQHVYRKLFESIVTADS